MKASGKRHGFLSLRTAGRAFWFGLAASLALHVLLLAQGRFEMPRWEEPAAIEAWLAPEEPRPPPPAHPRQTLPRPPAPRAAASPARASTSVPAAPGTPENPAAPPLPANASPADIGRPYAALIQAAESIRRLPAHMQIVYVLRGLLHGRQTHVWQIDGGHYTLAAEGEVTGLAGLFVRKKLVQRSSGSIGPLGLMPEQYEMQHISGKKEILRFDYQANLVESTRMDSRHGTRTLELPLMPGVQDPLSAIYQLAMAALDGRDGLIVAASSKKVKGYPYRMLGKESLRTPLGELDTLHVVRDGDTEKNAIHLWLSPVHHSLPVKIAYRDEDDREWVLEAVSIETE